MATASIPIGKAGKYGDLKKRLLFLLGALLVFRIGAHIPVPGIDPAKLAELFQGQQGGILGMFNMFSGGALSRFTITDGAKGDDVRFVQQSLGRSSSGPELRFCLSS